MLRPLSAFLVLFCLLSLIVHQVGMFEFLGAMAIAVLAIDIVLARASKRSCSRIALREPIL